LLSDDRNNAYCLMFSIKNTVPVRYPPVATWTLIAINCVVFLFEISLSNAQLDQLLSQFALVPERYSERTDLSDYLPFLTNMFLHGGWLHLILNMWTLWLFGPAIEDQFGPGLYTGFYLTCGLIASATHIVFNPTSTIPALGASGAIAGVLGCHTRLFPTARVIVLIPVIFVPFFFAMPGVVFTGLWFAMQVLQGTTELLLPAAGGSIAWWAHVGGFIAGYVLASPLRHSRQPNWPRYPDQGILGFDLAGR
jgi:membrane associated rhomboid family serine protease